MLSNMQKKRPGENCKWIQKWREKKPGKYLVGAAAAFATAFCVCSCIRMIDPVAYTQAILDVSYKNKTEQYMELTGAAQEDAAQIFEHNLETTSRIYKNAKLPETMENNYSMLFKNVIMQVRYTVGEATKTKEGNYIVKVSVEPMTLFDDTYETFREKSAEYARSITNDVMNGAAIPSEKEMKQEVYQIYYDILKKELDAGLKYGPAQTVLIHVNKTEEGTYEIPAEDIQMLDSNLISQKKLLEETSEMDTAEAENEELTNITEE